MSNTITITQVLSKESIDLIRKVIEETVAQQTSQSSNDDNSPMLIEQGAQFAGVTVSTFRKYLKEGCIKSYKKNKVRYVFRDDIIQWIKSEARGPKVRYRPTQKN
jgi:hypothetical protein